MEATSSLKVCNRVAAVLRRITLGLLVNDGMTGKEILLLCHGLVSESLPLLTKRDRYGPRRRLQKKARLERSPLPFFICVCVRVCVSREKASAKPPPDPRLPPPSCLLLPPTPKRGGRKAPVSSRTNMHILVDAGLKVGTPPPRIPLIVRSASNTTRLPPSSSST